MQRAYNINPFDVDEVIPVPRKLNKRFYHCWMHRRYDRLTHQKFAGGAKYSQPVMLSSIPVFQRGGSVLFTKERVRRCSSLMSKDPYTLTVALDKDGTFANGRVDTFLAFYMQLLSAMCNGILYNSAHYYVSHKASKRSCSLFFYIRYRVY